MIIQIKNQNLKLLAEKSLFWLEQKMLILSDLHLGKAESFQSFGVPVSSQINVTDLKRISELIESEKAEKVLFLGDFLHAKNAWTAEIETKFRVFLQNHPQCSFQILLGNHDRKAKHLFTKLPLSTVDEFLSHPPFYFSHGDRKTPPDVFQIQGHLHPVFVMVQGSSRVRLPCFVLSENYLILPSFGSFTGGFAVAAKKKQKIFLVVEERIVELP